MVPAIPWAKRRGAGAGGDPGELQRRRDGLMVECVKRVPTGDQDVPPQNTGQDQKHRRRLEQDGQQDNDGQETRLEHESGVLVRAARRGCVAIALLANELTLGDLGHSILLAPSWALHRRLHLRVRRDAAAIWT